MSFIKEYKGLPILNAKIKSDTPIFDTQKKIVVKTCLYTVMHFYTVFAWIVGYQRPSLDSMVCITDTS